MMSILGTLFIGLIAGFIARAIKPGNDSMGWIMTALLGVAGAFLAGYLGAALGFYRQGDPVGFIAGLEDRIARNARLPHHRVPGKNRLQKPRATLIKPAFSAIQ